MAEVFESDKPMIALDLSPVMYSVENLMALASDDFDTTLFLNGMLHFTCNRYTYGQDMATFLQNNMLKINQEYAQFCFELRKEKLKAMAAMMTQFREVNCGLQDIFVRNDLYNTSGILRIDAIDASSPTCAVATLDNSKWTQNFKTKASYSISGKPLEYLGMILLSA